MRGGLAIANESMQTREVMVESSEIEHQQSNKCPTREPSHEATSLKTANYQGAT
jgi:hypothetical protein